MSWNKLNSIVQVDGLIESSQQPILFFKHSTRCPISTMAKGRLERDVALMNSGATYLLDLITFREISNHIADKLGIQHESPQVIVVKGGRVLYHASHNAIEAEAVKIELGL